jgi:hypothetical protein
MCIPVMDLQQAVRSPLAECLPVAQMAAPSQEGSHGIMHTSSQSVQPGPVLSPVEVHHEQASHSKAQELPAESTSFLPKLRDQVGSSK